MQRTSKILVQMLAVLTVATVGCGEAPEGGTNEVERRTQELVIPNTSVGPGGPGGTWFNGDLYVTYTGTNNRINIMRFPGGTGNGIKTTLAHETNWGTSLVAHNGWLYMAWIGTNGCFNSMRSLNGSQFGSLNTMSGNCLYFGDPALVVHEGGLQAYISENWVNTPTAYQMVWNESLVRFQYWAAFSDVRSFQSLSATTFGTNLVLGFVGTDNNFNTKTWSYALGWTAPIVIGSRGAAHIATINASPPFIRLIGRLADFQGHIFFEKSTDGGVTFPFSTRQFNNHFTNARPFVLGGSATTIQYAHVGTDSNKTLNWNVSPAN